MKLLAFLTARVVRSFLATDWLNHALFLTKVATSLAQLAPIELPKTMNKLLNGVLADHEPKRLKIKKECSGCGDYFTASKLAKYDYCQACGLNGNRYIQNRCAE